MLKIAKKWPNFALGGQFWLQSDFFCKSPPPHRLRPRRGPTETKNFEPPHQKFREKTLMLVLSLFDPGASGERKMAKYGVIVRDCILVQNYVGIG